MTIVSTDPPRCSTYTFTGRATVPTLTNDNVREVIANAMPEIIAP